MLTKRDKIKDEMKKQKELHRQELLRELEVTKNALDTAYANLSYVVEPELIDCCIYELNAIQLRYKFILSQVKKVDTLNNKNID